MKLVYGDDEDEDEECDDDDNGNNGGKDRETIVQSHDRNGSTRTDADDKCCDDNSA